MPPSIPQARGPRGPAKRAEGVRPSVPTAIPRRADAPAPSGEAGPLRCGVMLTRVRNERLQGCNCGAGCQHPLYPELWQPGSLAKTRVIRSLLAAFDSPRRSG